MPIAPTIAQPMSALLEAELALGGWSAIEDEAKANYTSNICPEQPAEVELATFGLWDMIGPIMFLVIVSTASLIITRCASAAHRRAEALRKALDTDGDGKVSHAEMIAAQRAAWAKSKSRLTLRPSKPQANVAVQSATSYA